MRSRLVWKLLGINVLVIGVVIFVVWLAINYLAADYFTVLMEKYKISPTETHQMFLDAVYRYLVWASLFALALAAILSFLLTKRVLNPLAQMTKLPEKIASGDYTERIQTVSKDEVAQVATAFNRMVGNLQRLEQLRKTMIVDVAHELRTPLTNMRGYLEALIDGVAAPSRETFASLQEETLRLVKLVDDLLQLAKADAAIATLRPRGVILSELISESLEPYRIQYEAKGISVETLFAKRMEGARADPDKLKQVIRNLLENALQYTPAGGYVRIHIEQLSGEVRATFANTGGGIAESDLPYIFERFYRGEKSRSREFGGAGIGLAIVKELVEAHGGKVGASVSSDEVRICFTLPSDTTPALSSNYS
jgi:signal transduction histidine kinase